LNPEEEIGFLFSENHKFSEMNYTTARGATQRDIHLTRPAGWPKRQWKNYKRNFWNRAPK